MIVSDGDRALRLAEFLLQIKAIKLNVSKPFQWASGWNSPIYCDNRLTLSYPKIRTFIRQSYANAIMECFGRPDVIAGVATGGIAHGALVAQELDLPFIYVRTEPKGHGLNNQIEGFVEAGQNVVLVEDLISTGGSSLRAVAALKEVGCNVKGLAAIFTYQFELANKAFKEANCPCVTLTNYETVLQKALDTNYIKEADMEELRAWRENPSQWKKGSNQLK
jgi:orotate phosphoribosyltransferase